MKTRSRPLRRALLIAIGVLLIAGFAAWAWFNHREPSAPEFGNTPTPDIASLVKERPANAPPPNVVILLADDLGYGDTGFNGSDIETPNIDRIAREGMRLTQFYSLPICTPTRAALMTARDPIKLGLANAGLMPWNDGGVSLEERFMPEAFADAGYDTAMIGKWHLGHTIEQHTPNSRGFNHFYGHLNTQIDFFEHGFGGGHDLQENGKPVHRPGEYATDIHGSEAVRWLTELRDPDKPFLLYVPFLAPHSPMQAKEDDRDKYPHRIDIAANAQRTYAAMVDSLDQAVGRILDTLEAQGVADNTIVLFTSDNGGFESFGADNAHLRGGKTEVYEGGIVVPTAIRWPQVIPAGTVNDAVISVLDLFPTLAGASGIEMGKEKPLDGLNRWDALLGRGSKWRGAPLVFTSNSPIYNRFMHGVRDGKWKLVQVIDHERRSTTVTTELFDLDSDPEENRNLAATHPDQLARLQKVLDARLAQHPIGGVYVQLAPHPGWRAPKDYADAIIPADKVNEEGWSGYNERAAERLQQMHGERGRVTYD